MEHTQRLNIWKNKVEGDALRKQSKAVKIGSVFGFAGDTLGAAASGFGAFGDAKAAKKGG